MSSVPYPVVTIIDPTDGYGVWGAIMSCFRLEEACPRCQSHNSVYRQYAQEMLCRACAWRWELGWPHSRTFASFERRKHHMVDLSVVQVIP